MDNTSGAIYPSLLENTTVDSTEDVFFPFEDLLSASLSTAAATPPSTPHSSVSQLQALAESLANVASLLLCSCCKKQCLQNLTIAEVKRQQSQFQSLSLTQQRQWLMDY